MKDQAVPKRFRFFQFSLGSLLMITLAVAAFLGGRISRQSELDQLTISAEVARGRLAQSQFKKPWPKPFVGGYTAFNVNVSGTIGKDSKSEIDLKIERGMKADSLERKIWLDVFSDTPEGMLHAPVD